jgi:hypothetical protein
VRHALPWLLKQLGTHTLVDVPVGDFGYMRSVLRASVTPHGIRYVGLDIVPSLVEALQSAFSSSGAHEHPTNATSLTSTSRPSSEFAAKRHHLSFHTFDLARHYLWPTDLVVVRDVLFHFEPRRVADVLDRLGESGCGHILITTFPTSNNQRKKFHPGLGFSSFMPWNLEDAPFGMPPPLLAIGRDGSSAGRVMGLWPCAALRTRREVVGWGTGRWRFADAS